VAASEPAPQKSTEDEARLADTSVPKFVGGESVASRATVAGWSAERPSQGEEADSNPMDDASSNMDANSTDANSAGSGHSLRRAGNVLGGADGPSGNELDLNHQDEKLAFAGKSRHSTYLNSRLTAPISPFEIKTGTVIPGVLITTVSSDLPGELVAQVSQNVYDTATGEHLLIPQGTRLFGHYDSKVSFGQGRLLVTWERLIYPNAYTLELEGMSGHDEAGSVGLADRVNNHYGRMFAAALLSSVFSAGLQLSQPQQSSALTNPTSGQVAAAAVGQQVASLGVQIAQRNMQVQPNIEIRKGYRFNVMVNKDIVFPGAYTP
jgi:type IV secretion system protein VirB10